jgi:hypothetical protein
LAFFLVVLLEQNPALLKLQPTLICILESEK